MGALDAFSPIYSDRSKSVIRELNHDEWRLPERRVLDGREYASALSSVSSFEASAIRNVNRSGSSAMIEDQVLARQALASYGTLQAGQPLQPNHTFLI